jgi:hypothetical protein
MFELVVLLIGGVISGVLALIKVALVVATLSWAGVLVPLFIAVLIITGLWLPDLTN